MSFFTTRRFVLAAPLALMLLAATLRPAAAAEGLEARPGDIALGRADAPITMVEYYSLNCPHCGAFHAQIFPTLKVDYIDTGKVRFVFRDFPLSWAAVEAAILTHCAGPEKFLAVQDALFQSISQWSRAESSLLAVAKIGESAGVERAQFKQCVEDGALEKEILANYGYAVETLGVGGTPTFFINGEKHVGGLPLERLAEIFSNLLDKSD